MDREEFRSLVEELRRTPTRLRELMAGLPSEKEAHKPGPDAFSARENVHHLRDIEAEGYGVRLLRMLGEPDSVLKDIDGSVLARERNYNGRPSGPALEEFALLRAANVERLQRLAPDDLERTGSWENVGPVTLGKVLEMWRDHDRGHLDEIAWLAGRLPAEPKHNV
ncbi:MAG: DinB family protein [Thermoanaerobaculia bacterium]